MKDALSKYISTDLRKVDGWLTAFDARLIAALIDWQASNGVSGCLGEIGVHHGKLLILLQLGATADEAVFGVDLFEDQAENVDRSGHGNREMLNRNADRYGGGATNLIVLKRNSLTLDWADLKEETCADCRFFSIDGGHTAGITENDLAIADRSLADGGVICVDDYFNKTFPEVSIGVCRYMDKADLVPVAISENKVFLCRPAFQAAYLDVLRQAVGQTEVAAEAEFFGTPTLVLARPRGTYQRVKTSSLARRLRDTPMGEALKPVVRRLLQRG